MKLKLLSVLIVVLILVSIFAPFLVKNDPYKTDAAFMRAAPSQQYPFGNDHLGRCVYSRVLMGARTTIFASVAVVLICTISGTVIGMLAGYFGGFLDNLVMRVSDVFLAFPQMVLAIAIAGVLGGNMLNAMIALSLSGWTLYARLTRSKVLSLKHEDFIYASRLSGSNPFKIMVMHLLPNVISEVIVNGTIQLGMTMLGLAGLSYLGLGVQLPHAEWGSMINEARGYMQLAPWAVIAPSAALFITVLVFNLFGDTLADLTGLRGMRDE